MRFLLSFLLVFLCVFATAQIPPMILGGPQGISSKRVLAEQWISIPVMIDTPAAPLVGAPWPGRGYIAHVAKASDTTVWHYTGARWVRIGGTAENNYTNLVTGGKVTRNPTLNRFTVGAATYYINGALYNSSFTQLLGFPKTANANGRIDIIALATTGPIIIQGTESTSPVSPNLGASRIQLGFVYYPPFDTLSTSSGNGINAIFRTPGRDSIFFSTADTTLAIKDSIGLSVANNGLTGSDKTVKLGGSLIENTNINLSSRRLNILAGSDTARFFANGSLSLGATPSDSTYRFNVNGGTKTDSLVVDSLYAKFGRYIASPSTPFAPIEFRVSSSKTRIDLRPSSSSGWNSNWYGAITHDGYETDILSAPYGGLYLGTTGWAASKGIFLGNTRSNPSMRIRENNNVLIGDTAITAFKFDVNGTARVRDTLTLATSPVTTDTTANDLLVINSSNGQVRRYTGNWPVPGMPTLQQVTTAGNSTTDSLNIKTPLNKLAVSITSFDFAGAENTNGEIKLRNTFDSSYLYLNELGIERYFSATGLQKQLRFNYIRNQYSQISIPDSSGTLTQRVKVDGATYNTNFNGVVDLSGMWINGSATLDFGNTTAQNSADLTITVTGAATGDVVSLGVPNGSVSANTCFTAWVSATDTVTVRFNNYSSGAVDPSSGTFKVKVFK
jgi:hypothetical protein